MVDGNRTDSAENRENGGPRVSRRGMLGVGAVALAAVGVGGALSACGRSGDVEVPTGQTDAGDAIAEANKKVAETMPFSDTTDFADADHGFIEALRPGVIKDDKGKVVWDNDSYGFLQGTCPSSANPSLWRQSQLTVKQGLYEVAPGFYQIRGLDLSNMTIIEGDKGIVVIDPLISNETAAAGLALYRSHRGDRPVTGLVYSHAHVDHFGGSLGVTTREEVAAGRCPVVAPSGFLEHAVSENIYAGTAMARRAAYMYGAALPRGEKGQIGAGLGQTTSVGTTSLIDPTITIDTTGQEQVIDGVRMVFQMTPGTEAPSEMNFYFPDRRILCMAENATHTLHNILTLRGALVRDPRVWSKYLTESINLYARQSDIVFSSHHWPIRGTDKIVEYLSTQRDLYGYLNDQTLRMLNQGMVGSEIAEAMQVPPNIQKAWYTHGYYGSVSHNVKAIYQRYMGWFDGNPAHLWEHPPVENAKRHVDAMGGATEAIKKAKKAYDDADYRWAVQVLNYVIFADADNKKAKDLQASAFEQLGYGSENATWRNFYLSGAYELRNGSFGTPTSANSKGLLAALTVDQAFDAISLFVNGPKAWDTHVVTDWRFSDQQDKVHRAELRNGVLVHYDRWPNDGLAAPDATITLTRGGFIQNMIGGGDMKDAIAKGDIKIDGNAGVLLQIKGVIDKPDPNFAIVTP